MRHRRKMKTIRAANTAQRGNAKPAADKVLTWADLTAMGSDELNAVAERMGITPDSNRMKTASAINTALKAAA